MRRSLLALLAGATSFVYAQSLSKEEDPKKENTYFNTQKVPPLLELTPNNWEEEMQNSRFLVVKHYSPYCSHCIEFAPTYQTLYEYYYTSKPAIEKADETSFLEYYDFRFGSLNCIAYYDLCVAHGVSSYPMTVLYENGEPADTVRGVKNITVLTNAIEPILEKHKPGSRPKTLDLPEAGDAQTPHFSLLKKEQDTAKVELREPDEAEAPKFGAGKGASQLPSKNSANKSSDKKVLKEPTKGSDSASKGDAEKAGKSSSKGSDGLTEEKDQTKIPGQADWKNPTSAETHYDKAPKKPTRTPNPNGASISLNPESFQRMVTLTQDPWFIKFYAPWCPHCQAMAPTWEQLAKNMEGKLNIGEVNCEKEKRLCKDVHASAFPTLLFFKGGERAEYQGLRGLGDFVQYADRALELAGGVPDVDLEAFEALEEKADVIFVYFYDHATTSEDFTALERLPLSLIGHAKLVKTNDPAMFDKFKITTWPRLLVSRESRPTYYTPLTPNEMRDTRGVLDWMRSVWLPLVPEMTASNARQIMDGKIVAVAVLDREDQDAFQAALREMKSAANEWMDRQILEFQLERKKLRDAKQMRLEEAEDRNDERALRAAKSIRINMDMAGRKEVGFAWVDGVFWQRWIRTTYGIDVKDGERVIINDQDSRKYWDNSATGNYILVSRTSIMETLDKIVYGPHIIKPKLTISAFEKIFFDIGVAFKEHPYFSVAVVLGLLLGAAQWYRSRVRRTRGGHFRLDEGLGFGDFKEGMLGQNGNAKAD